MAAWRSNGVTLAAMALLAVASGGPAFADRDCAPVGALPNYTVEEPAQIRDYDAFTFTISKGGDETEEATVAGRKCAQAYAIKDGAEVASDLEIQSNYRDQLRKLGGRILFEDGHHTVGRLAKGGEETWVHVFSQESHINVTVIAKRPFAPTLLRPAGGDYRLLGRMPNYRAEAPEKRNFDELTFVALEGEETREVKVQGARYSVRYTLKDAARPSSDLDIHENYRTALRHLGAQLLFTDDHHTHARLHQGDQSIWVRVFSQESDIEIGVIEEKPFRPSIKPPEARGLKDALDREGRVALYLHFDLAKSALRPEAAPVIAQIVKLLKDNPRLALSVDGHTDNIGAAADNLRLSQQRAAAVVEALAAQGIARDRLKAAGYGAAKPIADNDTAEGRAKNRRVELVKS